MYFVKFLLKFKKFYKFFIKTVIKNRIDISEAAVIMKDVSKEILVSAHRYLLFYYAHGHLKEICQQC